jgi:hypothetical protein
MRKFKFILPLIAVLLLVGAGLYAMHANKSQAKAYDVEYWDYNGPIGGEDTASYYSLGTSTPTHLTCGDAEVTVCQIKAEPDPANPNQPNLNGLNPKVDRSVFSTKLRDEE